MASRCEVTVGDASGTHRQSRLREAPSLLPVVVTTGSEPDLTFGDLVDKSVLIRDPTRPVALKTVLQRFGLADTFIAVAHDVLDEVISSQTSFIQRVRAVSPPPDSSRSIAVINRRAFSGLRSRYAVSLSDW